MRALVAAGGGILIGVGLAWAEAYRRTDALNRERYDEQLETHKRVLRALQENRDLSVIEGPADSEEDLIDDEEIRVGGEMIVESDGTMMLPEVQETVATYGGSNFQGEMEYSLEYIEEEDYHEEDGRSKEQIQILMGADDVPLFMMDGAIIDDWADRVGETILVDFYRMVPPGRDRVLYVRNNKRDEDYEVIQESV